MRQDGYSCGTAPDLHRLRLQAPASGPWGTSIKRFCSRRKLHAWVVPELRIRHPAADLIHAPVEKVRFTVSIYGVGWVESARPTVGSWWVSRTRPTLRVRTASTGLGMRAHY